MKPIIRNLFIIIVLFLLGCKSDYKKNREFVLENGNYLISDHKTKNHSIKITFHLADSAYKIDYNKRGLDTDNHWKVLHIEGHYYKIQSVVSGGFLTIVKNNKSVNGFEVVLLEDNSQDSQIWIIQRYKDNKYKISSRFNNHCLFASGMLRALPGLRVCSNRFEEFWNFEKIE